MAFWVSSVREILFLSLSYLLSVCFYKSRSDQTHNKVLNHGFQKQQNYPERTPNVNFWLTKKYTSFKLRKLFKIKISINSFQWNVSFSFCGLIYLSSYVSLHSQLPWKNQTLINRLLKVTLEEEMKKPLLCHSFLPGEWDRNSISASAGWRLWKISLGLWSPRAPERANWTNQSWVMCCILV